MPRSEERIRLFAGAGLAEEELHRAVPLDPTLVEARTWYGELLMERGDSRAASVQFRAALALNTSWTQAGDDLALLAYLRRDYSQSKAYSKQSLAQSPADRSAAFVLALSDGQTDRQKAERELRALGRTGTPDVDVDALLSFYESQDGNRAASNRDFARAQALVRERGVVTDPSAILSLAAALASRHEHAAALAWLERVDSSSRRLFAPDPRLDPLRADSEFKRWLRESRA